MTDHGSLTPFSFPLGSARITAICDGIQAMPIGNLYRLGTDQPTPEKFIDAANEISVNVFLVERSGETILIDAGSGAFSEPEHGTLQSALDVLGISADAIDHVILTHIHGDHIGGLITDGVPAFKNATIHIGKTEAAFWLTDGAADAPHATERVKRQIGRARSVIDPYKADNRFVTFDDDDDILPGFSAILRAGHTPGHLSIRFETDGEAIVFVGDIVHGDKVQFQNPAVTIDFDYDQPMAAISRAAAFAHAADEAYLIAAAHLPFPGIGHFSRDDGQYCFSPYAK